MVEDSSTIEMLPASPIGIDLGTTYSAVAVYSGGKPHILEIEGQRTIPSIVHYPAGDSAEPVVGKRAQSHLQRNPERTVALIKRHMGESDYRRSIDDREYTARDVSADILRYLLDGAQRQLGGTITTAVVTVPAYFTQSAKEDTLQAARDAGLQHVSLLPEPTAAALAYAHGRATDQHVLIYDLGGGTFDVSIIKVQTTDPVRSTMDVIGVGGDSHLGGADFTEAVYKLIAAEVKEHTGLDLLAPDGVDVGISKDKLLGNRARLLDAAEEAKLDLSSASETQISVPNIMTEGTPYTLDYCLSRGRFEELITTYIDRTEATVRATLAAHGLTPAGIDRVLLVGGSSAIPLVAARVTAIFEREPFRDINPAECVALGAAMMAAESTMVGDAPPPIAITQRTVHDFGIAVSGRVFDLVVPRDAELPVKGAKLYYTQQENQRQIAINVYQSLCAVVPGESPPSIDHNPDLVFLDEITLNGIPQGPKGAYAVDVAFDIDTNDTLSVTARCTRAPGYGGADVAVAESLRIERASKRTTKAAV